MHALAVRLPAFVLTLTVAGSVEAQQRPAGAAFPMPAPAPVRASPQGESAAAPGWRGSTVLGLSSGLGSPYGLIGGFVGYFPLRHLQLEIGGGYSAGFGPSIAALGRVGFNPVASSFMALGAGVSTSFADFRYAENCEFPANSATASRCTSPATPRLAEGSASALWLNLEASDDVRLGRSLGARIAFGVGVLLNPGAFPTALGCASDGLGTTPCDVGAARTRDEPTWLLHVRLDLYAVIVRGDP